MSFAPALVLSAALLLPAAGAVAQEEQPSVALVGTEIEFRGTGGFPVAMPRVVAVETDGSVRRLSSGEGHSPSWSADGSLVAYAGASNDLRLVERDGARDRVLLETAVPARRAWSPDGREVLALTGGDAHSLVAVDVATAEARPLYSAEGLLAEPAWSPDGTLVAFGAQTTSGGQFDVWLVGADGGGSRELTTDLFGAGTIAWSPDGRELAVAAFRQDAAGATVDAGIHVVAVDGSGTRLLEGPSPAQFGAGQTVAWSPDGAWIAYDACQPVGCGPPGAVAVVDPAQVAQPAYVAPVLGAESATLDEWLPDGDLLVTQPDGASGTTVRVPLHGGEPQRLADALAQADGIVWTQPPLTATVGRMLWWSRMLPDGSAPTVLLGRSDDFADSLASGGAQGSLDAPLLLTNPERLDEAVAEELERLGTTEVVVLGGSAAVSPGVEEALVARGLSVRRVAGPTRLETAVAVAEAFYASPERVLLARAFAGDEPTQGFADSLAAGAVSAALETPLLLTATGELSEAVASYLDRTESVVEVVVVGGQRAVGDAVVAALEQRGLAVLRVGGEERAATAVALSWFAAEAHPNTTPGRFALVDGEDPLAWADGFGAALHADPTGSGGVLLARGATVPQVTLGRLVDSLPGARLSCASLVTPIACRDAALALSTADPDAALRATASDDQVLAELRVVESSQAQCQVATVENAELASASIRTPEGAELATLPEPGGDGRAVACYDIAALLRPPPAADLDGMVATFELADGRVLQAELDRLIR